VVWCFSKKLETPQWSSHHRCNIINKEGKNLVGLNFIWKKWRNGIGNGVEGISAFTLIPHLHTSSLSLWSRGRKVDLHTPLLAREEKSYEIQKTKSRNHNIHTHTHAPSSATLAVGDKWERGCHVYLEGRNPMPGWGDGQKGSIWKAQMYPRQLLQYPCTICKYLFLQWVESSFREIKWVKGKVYNTITFKSKYNLHIEKQK
jgi:hypothetical protein